MKTKKRAAAAALAVSLAAAFPLSGYADVNPIMGDMNSGGEESGGAGPSIDDQIGAVKPKDQLIDKELLTQNRLEYREIGSRIEYYNKDYRNAKTQLLNAYLSLDTAGALTQEANELMEEAKDFKYDDMTPEDREYYEWYKDAVQELRRQAQKITNADLPGSAERTLRLARRNLTRAVEMLLITYQTTEARTAVADKNVELAAAMLSSKERMASLGMSSAQEVLAAKEGLLEAQNSAQTAHAGLLNMRQNILIMLGWSGGDQVEFAPIGDPDLSRLAAMNLEEDKKAAISANTDLYELRSSGASGSAGRKIKERNVSSAQQNVAIEMERLYTEVAAKKQAYDAACTEFAAASQNMDAANRKHSLGMMGELEYLGAQLSYLNSEAGRTGASLELFKAMEDYDWAVNGLIGSNGG
ncbi:TolC family protein [Otoolea muris]|uniref:TolC family protein n=1 Tax=Otoolea muris TaxID=2941515 RepID=UPI00203B548E|nr:TolC family protein [Otoolea muris]